MTEGTDAVRDERAFSVPLGRLLHVAPGLPTTDMARTVEHYGRLGFTFTAPQAADPRSAGFAIGRRDGIELHFAVKPDHDPARTATWVYVRVADADELAAEFAAAGAGQPGREPRDTDYGMRDLPHIDPDGNLILFGSPITGPQAPPVAVSAGRAGRACGAGGAGGAGAAPAGRPLLDFVRVVKAGDVDRLRRLLAADPALARSRINGRLPLHLYADAPGHRPNPAGVVAALAAAGADLDAHADVGWHHETALHWAASNDDVGLIDALLDAGADIEHPGSSIGGGPPAQSALGYAQWAALRRLYERGARINLAQAAALGLMPLVTSLVDASPPSAAEEISVACWNACRAGQLEAARYLAGHGADLSWPAPWSGETPLDAAAGQHQRHVMAWLAQHGARGAG